MSTIKAAIFSIGLRLFVYGAGFGYYLLLASILPKEVFGEYSLWQSAIELCIVLLTMGGSVLYFRKSLHTREGVPGRDIIKLLVSTVPLVAGLLFTYSFVHDGGAYLEPLLALLNGILLSISTLTLAWHRGQNKYFLLQTEAGIRAVFASLLLVLATTILAYGKSVSELLAINLLASVGNLAIILINYGLPTNRVSYRLRNWTMFATGVLNFFTRKGDILLISFLMPLEFIASFKISFLVSESAQQFSQSFYIRKSNTIVSGTKSELNECARTGTIIGLISLIIGGLFLYGYGIINSSYDDTLHVFWFLAPYFLVKSYTGLHDQFLQVHDQMPRLKSKSSIELLIRLLAYIFVWLASANPLIIFLPLAIADLIIHLWFYRRSIRDAVIHN